MPATIHTLKVTLQDVRPPVWRRIEVSSRLTLGELSVVLETVMGWYGGHLHSFDVDGATYGMPEFGGSMFRRTNDEKRFRLGQVLTVVKATMRWDYDFGDGWEHIVAVEAIGPADPTVVYPRCIGGRRACPPEDCGGSWGYQELLAARADPDHPRRDELMEWLPAGYNPAHFSADQATADMRRGRDRFAR